MMTQIKNKIQVFSEYAFLLRKATRYMWVASGVCFGVYLYLVGATTFSVVERQGLEEETKVLLSDISRQELLYLEKEKELTKSFAYSIGLVDAPSISFTTQQRSVAWYGGR